MKLTNTDMGELDNKWGNGDEITGDRSRDVFKTFLHTIIDCLLRL